MSFAAPSALFLIALAIPIVFFYILKVRLRRVEVSTNLFWKQVYDEKPPRSLWQYLRHLLSLLMQLAILALLVAAIADPYFPWQLLQARRVVAVIDNSASMRATDIEPTRFEAAIREALTLVEGLRFRDEMAIVLAGPQPEVVLGMNGHIPTLKRAIHSIKFSDNPTKLTSAVKLARRLISDHPRGQIIVFTDGCVEAVPATAVSQDESNLVLSDSTNGANSDGKSENQETTRVEIDYRLFGKQAANIGITQFQVRRSLIDPLGYEVLVAVRNASDVPVSCRLELELDGAVVDILPLDLDPEESWSRSLEKTSLEGGQLMAKLTQMTLQTKKAEDRSGSPGIPATSSEVNALSSDDSAWAVLPPRETQNVLLVTAGNLFLHKVFEANPLVRVEVVHEFPSDWPKDAVIVLHGNIPDKLPNGHVFVVDPAGSCNEWELREMLDNPIVTQQDQDSPLMTHVRLDNVMMPEARELRFNVEPHVLAGSLSGSPIYAELMRSEGKCLVLTINLDRSDLAFRTAFPILVTNALGWFAGSTGELRESSATGSRLAFDADLAERSSEAWVLSSPSGKEISLAAHLRDMLQTSETDSETSSGLSHKTISLGPLDECGIWSVGERTEDKGVEGEKTFEFAVNLASTRESDLRPDEELLALANKKSALTAWLARPVWFYLVVVGCALSVLEWVLYQRRVIS